MIAVIEKEFDWYGTIFQIKICYCGGSNNLQEIASFGATF